MSSIEEVIVELRHVVAAKSGVNWRLNDFQNNRQGAICIRCTFSLRTIEDLHRIRLQKSSTCRLCTYQSFLMRES